MALKAFTLSVLHVEEAPSVWLVCRCVVLDRFCSPIVCDTEEFTVDESWLSAGPTIEGALALSSTLATHEKAIIEDALRASGGRVFGPSGAAARLGIPRSTLESKIRALRINKNRFRPRPAKN
jgi:formate hydrogenlyase transcriptional activator